MVIWVEETQFSRVCNKLAPWAKLSKLSHLYQMADKAVVIKDILITLLVVGQDEGVFLSVREFTLFQGEAYHMKDCQEQHL